MAKSIKDTTTRLSNNVEMPIFGLGLYKMLSDDALTIVPSAYNLGYRLFDSACIYKNEAALHQALQSINKAKDGNIFITSKLQPADHGYEKAWKAIKTSINLLGRIDLYLIHWPAASRQSLKSPENSKLREETWRAFEEAYEQGLFKAIGVSNYTLKHLEEMEGYAKIMPHVNQVELHPAFYRKQQGMLEYCKVKGIAVQAYASLGEGKLLEPGLAPEVDQIAQRHGKTLAQIYLRWPLQHGWLIIPKTVSQQRLAENMDLDFELSPEEMNVLDTLNDKLDFKVCWNPEDVA